MRGPFGSPYDEDPSILGSILGPPVYGPPSMCCRFQLRNLQLDVGPLPDQMDAP